MYLTLCHPHSSATAPSARLPRQNHHPMHLATPQLIPCTPSASCLLCSSIQLSACCPCTQAPWVTLLARPPSLRCVAATHGAHTHVPPRTSSLGGNTLTSFCSSSALPCNFTVFPFLRTNDSEKFHLSALLCGVADPGNSRARHPDTNQARPITHRGCKVVTLASS